MSGKTFLLILLFIPVLGFSQVVEFTGRYDVSAVEYVNDSTWKLYGEFFDATGSYTALDADTNDKILQRGYNSDGRAICDVYKIVGIDSCNVRLLDVFVRSDFASGVQNMFGMPLTGSFPIASPVNDTSKLTYRTSYYQNQIDPDYDAFLDNLNLKEMSSEALEANDSIYAHYKGVISRTSGWIRNDTIDIDTTFTRIYGGGINTVTGSYPNYTITGTEIDGFVSNEFDSVYVKYADSTRSGWVRNDTIFIDTSGARAMLPQGLNSVMAIDSNTFHQYQGFVWGKRAGIHLQNFSNAPAISLTRASEDATIADSVIAALWGGGSTGYWDGTMLWNKYLKDSAKVVQFNYKKAKLEMRASQTWDQSHNGTYFSFMTTHNDSIIPRDRMRIGHNGNITFFSPGQASSFDSVYVKDVSTGNMKTVYKSSVGATTDSTHVKAGNGIRVDSTGKTFTIVNISRDSTFIKSGTDIRVDSSGNTYTINNIRSIPSDSTFIKAGNAIRVDSAGNTYTIVNISKDSTYIKAGANITVDSTGNTYTINSSSWPSKDSTYVKSGTGIRVDSVNNTYTINNITRDSTYLKAGSHVSIDSSGNTYTINSIGWASIDSTYIKSGNGIRIDSSGNTYTVVNIARDSTVITGLGTNISVLEPSANNHTIRVTEKDSSVTNEYDSTYVDYTGRITGRSDEWVRNDTIKVDTSCIKLWSGGANVMIEGDCPDWTITVYDDDQSQFNEKDSVYANYTTIVNRSDEWIKNDTILIDTTFTRLYPGNNISISGTYPNYTVSASGVSLVDSTYIKAGNGIRIDSTGNSYTVTNISKDSTYIRSGTNIQVDSSGNTYTINTTGLASIDSLLWQRNASRKAMWTRHPDSVGIGTKSPVKLLHVYGSEQIKDSLFFSSSNHYITEGEEGMGLKTDELFLARWMKIDGNKVGYPLLQGSNNVNVAYDSSFLFTEKANLVLGDQTEKNYRLWVSGKIAAPTLTTAASEDSIIAWKASTGEFIAIPISAITSSETDPIWTAVSSQYRKLSNHDSLSKLDERSYESLSNKPVLSVTSDAPSSAVISSDSSDVIITAGPYNTLTVAGSEVTISTDTNKLITRYDTAGFATLTEVITRDTLVKEYARGRFRTMSNHDSLSRLDEKSYESLTNKPSLTVTADAPSSALITIDSASAILTADSGFQATVAGNEIIFKNTKRTLASLDEKSYNSLTDKPTIPTGSDYFAKADSNTNGNAATKKYVDAVSKRLNDSLATVYTEAQVNTLLNAKQNVSDTSTKDATRYWVQQQAYLTGNQSITLSGDVSGSGTTAITATVADDSHNHIISNVDNLQDSLTAKQKQLNGTGYVRATGTVISYDNSTFEPQITSKGDILGTTNQINVTGDNTSATIGTGVTLSLPQNIHTGASPEFATVSLGMNREINQNYLLADTNLQAYWRFEDLTDASGKGQTLSAAGGSVTYSSGVFSNAVVISSTPTYLWKNTLVGVTNGVYSIGCWFKKTGTSDGYLLEKSSASPSIGNFIYATDNSVTATRYANGANTYIADITTTVGTSWHHVVITYDDSYFRLYFDGMIADSVACTYSSGSSFSFYNYFYLNGSLAFSESNKNMMVDEGFVFNRVLSSSEISNLVTASQYTFPLSMGTAGQALKVSSSGTILEWGDAANYIGGYGVNISNDTIKADTSELGTVYDLTLKLDKSDTANSVRQHIIDANGDLIVGTGNNAISKLSRGSTGQLLAVKSDGFLEWVTPTAGTTYSGGYRIGISGTTINNTSYWKDQDTLNVSDGIVVATSKKLSAITNNSTNWNKAWDSINGAVYIPKHVINAKGDIITGTANNTIKRLSIGTAGQVLKVRGDTLYWGTDESGAGGTLTWGDTLAQLATDYDLTLKQNVSDTSVKDATRYWVSQQGYLKLADTTGKLATDYDLDTLQHIRTEVDPVYATDKSNIAFINQLNTFTKAQTISTGVGSYYPLTYGTSGGTTGYLYDDASGTGIRNYAIGGSGAMLYLSGTTARIYTGVTNEAISVNSDKQLTINAANGTTPIITSSQTLVSNLNADLLDGKHASSFLESEVDGSVTNEGVLSFADSSGKILLKSNSSLGRIPLKGGSGIGVNIIGSTGDDRYIEFSSSGLVPYTGAENNVDLGSHSIKEGSGANYLTLSPDSALRLHGNSTVWNDLMFPFTTGHRGSNTCPTFNADSLFYTFTINDTTTCIMYMIVQLPHDWKEGSTIYPHIHYLHETNDDTPIFRVKYKWANTGETTGTWKYYTLNQSTGTTDKTVQMMTNSTGISGSGKTISSILLCKIYLVSTTVDACAAYQFDIHYEKDGLGSNTETSKD